MKIIPAPGYALLQIIKEDFETVSKTKIIPGEAKDTSFFNRMKVIELGTKKESVKIDLAIGDVVIMSSVGAQIGVPGYVRNDESKWIDVLLVAQELIIAKIEGDIAQDLDDTEPVIINPHVN